MNTEATFAWMGPLPRPTPVSRPFWEAARQRRLLIQRSCKTGRYVFYPRAVSPFGTDDELAWTEVSGRGHVHAFAIAREATAPHLAAQVPYVIAIIELDEGPHLTANIVGEGAEDVEVGSRVRAEFIDIAPDLTLVQFQLDLQG